MRTMLINQRTFYYALYNGKQPIVDGEGYETGELKVSYKPPVAMRANISPNTGRTEIMEFGNLDRYDAVIVTDDMSCPIDEETVLFIDSEPTFDELGLPLYNYTVRRVAKSINMIAIAVSKVIKT